MKNLKLSARNKRQIRVRKKLSVNLQKPRLSVFRSNKYLYAQIIDDREGITLAAANEKEIGQPEKTKANRKKVSENLPKLTLTKSQRAVKVGENIARKAKQAKISTVKFDRGPYKYHGRIRLLAEAARKNGLNF